jgi:hypothetical protein
LFGVQFSQLLLDLAALNGTVAASSFIGPSARRLGLQPILAASAL